MQQLRFARRDGPRIFLDSRDLITLIEKSVPVSPSELGEELARRNGRIVLTYTNVAELVPHTDSQAPDPARVRRIMAQLERLPHVYFRVGDLPRSELLAAIDAFESGRPVRDVDPYVTHFWETFWVLPLPLARAIEANEKIALLSRWTLVEQVEGLLANRESLRFDDGDRDQLALSVKDDRERLRTSRGLKTSFFAGVKGQFIKYGWREPTGGIDAFCNFVHDTPSTCPAWRLAYDVYEEYRCNLTAIPTKNDIPDFTHLHMLPYVSHVTLDRAWRARCRQARDRRAREGVDVRGYDRIYENLDAVLRHL